MDKVRARQLLLATMTLWLLSGCGKSPAVSATSPASEEVVDADVTFKVKTALLQDSLTKDLQLAVVTRKGDVRLTGEVDTTAQREHVLGLARGAAGVHAVHDELTIKP